MKFIHTLLATALIASAPGASFAHGDRHANTPAGPVKKEQKDWGIAGDLKDVKRTIEITMSDAMRFTPNRIEVRQGETVRLVHRNKGKLLHEFVLGTPKELEEHAQLMKKFPTMEHGEPYMAHVGAGKRSEIVWNFNRAGEFDFACLIPGHYDAGMVGKIVVAARTESKKGNS